MRSIRLSHPGWLGAGICGLLLLAAPRPAQAQVMIDASQLNGKLPDWVDPAFVKPPEHKEYKDGDKGTYHEGRVWVPPVYRTVVRRCWCEPIYRPVCHRIWHEPVIQVCWERVWVPPVYEWRETCCGGREQVLVSPGHYDMSRREVVVKPGWWEAVETRELVASGHFEDKGEQELVSAGHWE
jgi:hypothetical protein